MQTTQRGKSQVVTHKESTPRARLLEIKRDFKVSVSKLFEAFKTSDAIKTWWWPKDLYADRVELDFREGGKYFINMKGFDQGGGGMVGVFEEIIENELIVMTDQFSDSNGKAISAKEAKMKGVWPEVVYITFEFEASGASASRFVLSQEGIPNELQKDCIEGWNQSFDKLENYMSGRRQ